MRDAIYKSRIFFVKSDGSEITADSLSDEELEKELVRMQIATIKRFGFVVKNSEAAIKTQ